MPNAQIQWHLDAQALFEVKELEANQQGLTSYECPCNYCHGKRTQVRTTIKKAFEIAWMRPIFPMANGGMESSNTIMNGILNFK